VDPQLKAQLRETISVAAATGVDAAGDPSYAAPATRSARVVNVTETHERGDGTLLKTTIAIVTETAVSMTDRIWLPGDSSADATLARVPRFIEKAIDEFGSLDFYRTKL